nr:hypothetical protein [Tanacetum cinerariifolium]
MPSKEGKVDSSKALDASLVVTKCSGTKSDKLDTSSNSKNYITHDVDAYIRLVNVQVPFAEGKTQSLVTEKTNISETRGLKNSNLMNINYGVCRQHFWPRSLKKRKVLGPGLQPMTLVTSSLGFVPNLIPQQPCNPPTKNDWDHLFQTMFDEYFNPPTSDVSPVQVAATPRAIDLADSPVSTSIDQDAPSTSIPSTQEQE